MKFNMPTQSSKKHKKKKGKHKHHKRHKHRSSSSSEEEISSSRHRSRSPRRRKVDDVGSSSWVDDQETRPPAIGPQLPSIQATRPPPAIGPILPPSQDHTTQEGSDDMFGPSLPPDLIPVEEDLEKVSDIHVIGPVLPSNYEG